MIAGLFQALLERSGNRIIRRSLKCLSERLYKKWFQQEFYHLIKHRFITVVIISYHILFHWFVIDTRLHFETITGDNALIGFFKMPLGIYSRPIEKRMVTLLYNSNAYVFLPTFEMDFTCLYKNHYLEKEYLFHTVFLSSWDVIFYYVMCFCHQALRSGCGVLLLLYFVLLSLCDMILSLRGVLLFISRSNSRLTKHTKIRQLLNKS